MESLILIGQPATMLMVAGYVFTLGIIREHIIRGGIARRYLNLYVSYPFFPSLLLQDKSP